MKTYKIPVFFKPTNSLRQIVIQPKEKIMKARVVEPVYIIKFYQTTLKMHKILRLVTSNWMYIWEDYK